MEWSTYNEYQTTLSRDAYFNGRWPYISEALAIAQSLNPSSILEAGARGFKLCKQSHTIDYDSEWSPTILHDIRKVPWPIKDKQYDLFIALQVWEHLNFEQYAAFKEAVRIAENIILSVPYQWSSFDDEHNNIDIGTMSRWTGYAKWKKVVIVPPRYCMRAIFLFSGSVVDEAAGS